jgi:hypothetical protein
MGNAGIGVAAAKHPYVYTTADGGMTWTAATSLPQPPAGGDPTSWGFSSAFYAPDGMHVWIVGTYGQGHMTLQPALWRSTDGGRTFTDASMSLKNWMMMQPNTTILDGFWASFALDANNIWIGGTYEHLQGGMVAGDAQAFMLYSSTGGM